MRALLFLLLLVCAPAWAATLAVMPGATGTGTESGADWNNRIAWDDITFVRGNTYCVMEGAYGSVNFTTAASGTTTITIKKATTGATECTSLAGWASTLGDAQATFTSIGFDSPYWIIDGVTRDENDWRDNASYGMEVTGMSAPPPGESGTACTGDNITIQYVHIGNSGTTFATYTGARPIIFNPFAGGASSCQDWLVSRVLIQNTSEFQCAGGEGLTIQYSYFYRVWSKEAIRGQIHCKDAVVRWNVFEDACQYPGEGDACTADIAAWDGSANAFDNWEIYGNVFWRTGAVTKNNTNGVVYVGDTLGPGPVTSNTVVYNNTIAGYQDTQAGIFVTGGSGNVCRNNIWYDTDAGGTGASCNTASNNSRLTVDPFVNYATGDFHLGAETAAGFNTGSEFPNNDTDMDGVSRGQGSSWDLGAFEFDGGSAPNAPTNFRLITILLGILLGVARTYPMPPMAQAV